ncbi:tyrosine-type recombinase/integrase [Novipirellula galeiformis]|uniref:tyrosine-type recombinase/integrase n=1 Tax=Novipirellula galeiformis TaxID=2528004 RepID=UPI0011B37F47|nr:phage integrase SAM-like domain-containing protein [Novipirellula galeiformis]
MAALEHVNKGGRDHYRLRILLDKRRKAIGLSDLDEAGATEAKRHVEHLVLQRKRQRSPLGPALDWLESIDTDIHDRLSKLGLCEARQRSELPRDMLGYMRAYVKSRTDWKKPENYKQSVDHLETFLKRDIPLAAMTKGEAERWHRWMMDAENGPGLSPNTAGQHIKRCRQMTKQAIDDRLIESNPFKGIKIDLRSDTSKNRFIDEISAVAILEACPDQEWRTLYALARYGGLRCPSEVLRLRWSDIQWDRGRFKVTAPKTERYGKGQRIVPLWPELLAELEDLATIAQPGINCAVDAYVIQRYRDSESNLRTTFNKIVERAGVAVFPKPFMALRASRRTELERTGRFANHVLNDWFGHSGAIAETHYLQTTEADYAEATGLERPTPLAIPAKTQGPPPPEEQSGSEGQREGQSRGQQESPTPIKTQKKPGKTGRLIGAYGCRSTQEYTPEDSNL